MATDKCEESLMLATLNDDCILTILERLPLDAIYSYSKTCKRIQRLCRDDFQRRFRNEINKTVEIEQSSRGTIHYQEKYVIHFNNLVRKLRIRGETRIIPEQVARFVKTKCDPSLNEITIDNDGIILDSFCKEISSFLQSVETVNLFQTVSRKVQTFLKYCPNLTTLSLCLLHFDETVDEIFEQKYPKLKHLHFEYLSSSRINPKNWKTFLQRNSQIQCIELSEWEWSTDRQSCGQSERMKFVEIVADVASNLKHLFLLIDPVFTRNFEQICGHLQKLCERRNFQSLELKFSDDRVAKNLLMEHANLLRNFKQLAKIHISKVSVPVVDLNRMFGPFVHLKSVSIQELQFDYGLLQRWVKWSTIDEIVSLLDETLFFAPSQLQELTIESGHAKLLFSQSMLFARHCKSLRKLSVFKGSAMRHRLTCPVAELNKARENLENAQQLTIFTDFNDNTTDLSHEFVRLQCVERDYHYTVDFSKKYCMSSAAYYHFVQRC